MQGLRFGFWGLEYSIWGSEAEVCCSVFQVSALEDQGSGGMIFLFHVLNLVTLKTLWNEDEGV